MVNNLNQEEIGELVELYPNPNQGKFKILIHSTTVNAVKILNAQGQTLTQYDKVDIKNNEISVEQMASGSYFLIVETDQRKGSLQFIVK
jgi:hypothetical protein